MMESKTKTIFFTIYYPSEQQRQPSSQAALHTVVVRLGGLFVLLLTVGQWADMFHVLICFFGEVACLFPSEDLLKARENVSMAHKNFFL